MFGFKTVFVDGTYIQKLRSCCLNKLQNVCPTFQRRLSCYQLVILQTWEAEFDHFRRPAVDRPSSAADKPLMVKEKRRWFWFLSAGSLIYMSEFWTKRRATKQRIVLNYLTVNIIKKKSSWCWKEIGKQRQRFYSEGSNTQTHFYIYYFFFLLPCVCGCKVFIFMLILTLWTF